MMGARSLEGSDCRRCCYCNCSDWDSAGARVRAGVVKGASAGRASRI